MAMLGAVAGIVSAIGGVVGAMVQAQGAQEAADDQAATQEAQAQAERRKGQAEAASKQAEAAQRDKQMKKVMSDQRAAFASSGGGVDSGSALLVTEDTATRGIYNRDATLWEGEEQRAGRESQARIYEMQADATRRAGQRQATSAIIGGVSGAFGAVGKIAGSAGGSGGGGGGFYYG